MHEPTVSEGLKQMLEKVKAGEFEDAKRISQLLQNHDLPNFVGAGGDKVRAALITRSLGTSLEAALYAKDPHQSASLITSAIGEWEKPVKGLPPSEHVPEYCPFCRQRAQFWAVIEDRMYMDCEHCQIEVSFEGGAYLLDCQNPAITLANIQRRIQAGEGRPAVTEFDMKS